MDHMSWQTFTAIPNGTKVFNHGYDQCVALANLYHEEEIGGSFVPVDSAYQWWTDFGRHPQLTSKYTPSTKPVAGAIFVSRYGIYNAPDGHIGVVTGVNPNGTFTTMEQNTGSHWPQRYVYRHTRDMRNILGFLHPKQNPATTPPKPAEVAEEEELEMANQYIAKIEGSKQLNAIFNTDSGFFSEFESADGKYNTNVARTFGVKDPTSIVTPSHYGNIKRSCEEVRQGK